MEPDKAVQEFEKIYNLYHEAIFRFVFLHTKKREVSLDVTADTFMKIWSHISSGKDTTYIRALAYRIAKNALIDLSRKKKASSLDVLLEEGFEPSSNDIDRELIEISFDTKKLYEILDVLSPEYKEILILRYIEDLSITDIAEYYKEEPGTTSVRLHRALKKARSIYQSIEKSYEEKSKKS
jgi:RNA polymerase sigma-70 factor, ECF subfamily